MNGRKPANRTRMLLLAAGLSGTICCAACQIEPAGIAALPNLPTPAMTGHAANSRIKLPAPALSGATSVEEALAARRSVRAYAAEPLTLADCAQLLWAAQGVTSPEGLRTAPSAGALYPLEVLLVAGRVTDLPAGVYRYDAHAHELALVAAGDRRAALSEAALGQSPLHEAPAVFVIAGVHARTTGKYGDRGVDYVYVEVGAAAQNMALQGIARNIGTVYIGAFDDEAVKQALNLAEDEEPLGLIPAGIPLSL